jgi:hypothetical protein
MTINSLFPTGSAELASYLAKHTVGSTITGPDKTITWTVSGVDVNPGIPPNPATGESVTRVILELVSPKEGTEI